MNGRSSKAAGVTKFRLKRVKSDTNGRMLNARYGVDGLRTKKQDANGNSSREYGAGISTSASTPLTQNSTAPSISYISGPMILGAEINGEFVYHLGDALSTVRDVVDDEGDVIRSFEFDEYGNLLSSSGSGTVSPKTWIGGLSVNDDRADSGLWNMGHRNYAGGVLGRFISRDPIGHAGGLNLYAYPVNPVIWVDPEGLEGLLILHTRGCNGAHSWIEYRLSPHFKGPVQDPAGSGAILLGGDSVTWGTFKGLNLATNYEKNHSYPPVSSIGAYLNNEQERALFEFIREEEEKKWSPAYNCSGFATAAWEAAGQSPLNVNKTVGVTTPWALRDAIRTDGSIFPEVSKGGGPYNDQVGHAIYGSIFGSSGSLIVGSSGSSAASSSARRR